MLKIIPYSLKLLRLKFQGPLNIPIEKVILTQKFCGLPPVYRYIAMHKIFLGVSKTMEPVKPLSQCQLNTVRKCKLAAHSWYFFTETLTSYTTSYVVSVKGSMLHIQCKGIAIS